MPNDVTDISDVTDEQKSKIRRILEQADADQASLADALTLIENVLKSPQPPPQNGPE
jgi:hypothetical protein